MKPIFLACLLSSLCAGAQKKSNTFIAAELLDQTYGISVTYNHRFFRLPLGVGGSVELVDIGQQKMGGIMPSLDLRYYLQKGKSLFIPMVQGGYNIHHQSITNLDGSYSHSFSGRESFAAGLGYSYQLTPTGGGPFLSVKYRRLYYTNLSSISPGRYNLEGVKLSVGWRF